MSSSISNSRRQLAAFVLAFALVLALLLGASEWLVRDQVLPKDDFRAHASQVRASTSSNAAFGDSHVARGFVPPAGFVNLAYPSEGVPHMAWKVEHYFHNKKAGRVILSADPHLFSPYRLRVSLGDYPARFSAAPGGLAILDPYYRAQLTAYWTAFIRNGGELLSQFERTDAGALLSPGDESKVDPRRRRYEARVRVRVHRIIESPRVEATLTTYRQTVRRLTEAGATVCMVLFPLSPDYRRAYAEYARPDWRDARNRLIARLKAIAAASGARFVDDRKAATRLSDFRDPDHLNAAAAKRYGPRLVRECFGT